MSNLYNLVLPTSVEPQGGWKANDRVVFKINHAGQQIRQGSVRLNGVLQLWRNASQSEKVTVADKLTLNPNAGFNGVIRQISTKFQGSVAETINEYGRLVAMKNESRYYQLDHATSSDAMLELMSFSNDAYIDANVDVKATLTQGMKFPLDDNSSELPFSIDLDICVNSSVDPLPYSRTGEIEISIILQDNTKIGLISKADTQGIYTYSLKNLELRFLTEQEQQSAGAIILESKSNDHIPTILNKFSTIEFTPAHAFDTVLCSFLKAGHDSAYNNASYDYLATEAITEQIEFMEFKINGQDNVLQYPLMKQTSEILYNYLLAWKPYIHLGDEMVVKKHGLTYTKLNNALKTGYGVGVHLHGGVDANSRVSFQISLKDAPTTSYRMFCYTIGKLIL